MSFIQQIHSEMLIQSGTKQVIDLNDSFKTQIHLRKNKTSACLHE